MSWERRRRYGYTISDVMDEIAKLREYMNNLFNKTFSELIPSIEAEFGLKEPLMDMMEDENDIIVTMEIPGVSKDDIKIQVYDNTLEVKAETKTKEEYKDKNVIRMERQHTGFYRKITLPEEVDFENAKASYENGILKIILPKKVKAKAAKEIKIE
ncbi:MAG: Hsp20/alpha crystallin family protein [Candidatus Asgardarchaeia archaeon]